MKYYVLKQAFINAQIWVTQFGPDDPIYCYDTYDEAQAKCDELAAQDPSRLFKVGELPA